MDTGKEIENLDDFVKLSTFADIGIGIAAAKTINEAMDQVMSKVGDILTPKTWCLLLLDKDKKEIFFKLASGANANKLIDKRFPHTLGIPGWIIENGQATVSEIVSQDKRHSSRLDSLVGYRVDSILGAPITINEEVNGLLLLINKENNHGYTSSDINILSTIADFAAITIEKVYYLSALKDMSNVDALTGVYNKRNFENQFLKEAERCKRYGHQMALILVDIDNMKEINEKLGHPAGDEVLKDMTRIMRKNTRRIDIIGRYGGNMFGILLPHTKKHEGEVVRQRIEKDIIEENKKGKEIPYTVTLGLDASGPDKASNLIEAVEKELNKTKDKKAKEAKKKQKK